MPSIVSVQGRIFQRLRRRGDPLARAELEEVVVGAGDRLGRDLAFGPIARVALDRVETRPGFSLAARARTRHQEPGRGRGEQGAGAEAPDQPAPIEEDRLGLRRRFPAAPSPAAAVCAYRALPSLGANSRP